MSNFPGNPFGFGFVYFNNSPNTNNTSDPNGSSNDYLEFSNSESPGHFSPSNSSSPNQFRQRNFRGGRNNKMHNRNRYNSYNSSYESNNKNSSNFRNHNNSKSSRRNPPDISEYIHSSMMENPWFELEETLNQKDFKKNDEDSINEEDNSILEKN